MSAWIIHRANLDITADCYWCMMNLAVHLSNDDLGRFADRPRDPSRLWEGVHSVAVHARSHDFSEVQKGNCS